jgi:thiamine-phosphate pyrophosphorylase
VVTDDEVLHRPGFLSDAAELLEVGGTALALHVRGPRSGGATIHELARGLAPLARAAGARLLVNDRVDVAVALGLDGVHLGQRSLPPSRARALLGPAALMGVSTHSDVEVEEAVGGGADYVFVGAVYPTASHPGAPGRGPEALREARNAGIPVLAIGGIRVSRVAEITAAGAHGVAVVGGVWHAPHPRDAVIAYLHALEQGTGA